MDFISSNWEDIHKYYRNTYVKLPLQGEKLFLVNDVSPEWVRGIDQDNNDFEIALHDAVPYPVDFLLPRRSLFQKDNKTFFLTRIPARQYKRGICSENTKVSMFSGTEGVFVPCELGFETLSAYVAKPAFNKIEVALSNKKNHPMALSSCIMFWPKRGTFYIYNYPIASLQDGKLIMTAPIFKQELYEILSGTSLERLCV